MRSLQTLLKMDERQLNVNYKFGVLHARHGQTTEEEFFANGRRTIA